MDTYIDRGIDRITIVGAGTTGYLTAFHLAHTYPNKTITWIYPEENQPIGVGEAIVPLVSDFLKRLGITHQDIINHCNGALKLGAWFEDFNVGKKHVYTFPFGFGSSSPAHNTSSMDRIMNTHKIPKDMLKYENISTHFRATDLLSFMDTRVKNYPNLHIKRKTVTKEELEGTYDFLIDATGFRKAISYMPDNFVSIKDKIPNDKALVFRHPYTNIEDQCHPYTKIKGMEYGWCWHIPLKDQLAIGYVHDSKFDVRDEFHKYAEKKFNIKIDPNDIKEVKMITGRNKVHLKDNVVAVGLASTFIEPLESTGLWLVSSAAERICSYIDGKISEEEYNNDTNYEYDGLTEFIVAHYRYTNRTNPYWDFYKTVPVKRQPILIFPNSGWDTIISAFLDNVSRPIEPIDPKEFINIHRGVPYYEWLQNEKNFT